MKKLLLSILPIIFVLFISSKNILAAEQYPYSMDILINGVPVNEYYAHNQGYIEALAGVEYSIRIQNNTGERVAVALSVDGLNTIDAKHTSAYKARKWILQPYQSTIIQGWQTSSSSSRKFFFTKESNSYGSWLGKTNDLGNISAAFFKEDLPIEQYYPYNERQNMQERSFGQDSYKKDGYLGGAKQSAPSAKSESSRSYPSAVAPMGDMNGGRIMPQEELAATGIGSQQYNPVKTVGFQSKKNPERIITLRYEFRAQLQSLGIYPTRNNDLYRREQSRGFTDGGFAPDPYRN